MVYVATDPLMLTTAQKQPDNFDEILQRKTWFVKYLM